MEVTQARSDLWVQASLIQKQLRQLFFPDGIAFDEKRFVRLPEGMAIELVVDDESSDLSDQERRALHAAYRHRGRLPKRAVSASEILDELRRRR